MEYKYRSKYLETQFYQTCHWLAGKISEQCEPNLVMIALAYSSFTFGCHQIVVLTQEGSRNNANLNLAMIALMYSTFTFGCHQIVVPTQEGSRNNVNLNLAMIALAYSS
ncbi:hypothetical protein [Sphingobacterium sp.]|uniref:hypothetical protein n=1 Tax=Sphingobacterium sp. TaxID=341027 RepID=UPI0028ACCB27|nr:hypothetical protein [Sphingobacterium sp.]